MEGVGQDRFEVQGIRYVHASLQEAKGQEADIQIFGFFRSEKPFIFVKTDVPQNLLRKRI